MITIRGMSQSGNCYKLLLLLEQMDSNYRWIEVDAPSGATRTPEFLARYPQGKVPVLELDDGRVLTESNAILYWLAGQATASGPRFLPEDPWLRAQALSWMFFEQYSHEPYLAVARFIRAWLPPDSPRRAELPRLRERGHQALASMERHLAAADWFTGPDYGIADVALFAYTHCAADGGFDLASYPCLERWLARVRATPGFVPMPALDAETAARLALPDAGA
ncbi:glutathione S-transferase [Pseudoxanthomonas broegbernensis]|uniref:Glutathione S-transferase n=1 Tax=Pseudoxanthomonas broegbernensis TaxID=83619 RepID=A0A7V8GPW8_9GAMM|nr:glutathione S-transferase family protein [Pseudoxanthomonas broegbernensis]KAF1688015.1 glutathione S-transferase [Pseudoxanthomonas broegbernensis]MBB6065036.1 glutathione S-transferase [Pseudoxanthomonas broegbernensis]